MQVTFNGTRHYQPVQFGSYSPRHVEPKFGGFDDLADSLRQRLRRGRSGSGGGSGKPPKSLFQRVAFWGKWGMTGLLGLVAVGNVGWDNNPNSTYSIVNQKYIGEGIKKNPDGTCDVQGSGLVFPLIFAENYQFDTRPQVVKMTFQPFTADGVPVDGSGQPNEGMDFRITYSIMPDDPAAGIPTFNRTLCEINDNLVGSSRLNPNFKPLKGTTVEYVTSPDNERMKMIFETKILPHLSQAFLTAATRVEVKDLQESRGELENYIVNGLYEIVLDSEGNPVMGDDDKPLRQELIPPLNRILQDANLRLDGAELSTIDIPDFLARLNQERTDLNINMTNAQLDIEKAIKDREAVPKEVEALKAQEYQEQLGTNRKNIADAEQQLARALEAVKRMAQEAQVYRNEVIENARGYERTKVLQARENAVQILAAAYVLQQQKQAEAVKVAAPILESARAMNETLTALGAQLRANPNLIRQITAELTAEARAGLADNIDTALLTPGTSPDQMLDGITVDKILRLIELQLQGSEQ